MKTKHDLLGLSLAGVVLLYLIASINGIEYFVASSVGCLIFILIVSVMLVVSENLESPLSVDFDTPIYETPNGLFGIFLNEDFLNEDNDEELFLVGSYKEYEDTNEYLVIASFDNLSDCFRYLNQLSIISKDEMQYQIEEFSEISNV